MRCFAFRFSASLLCFLAIFCSATTSATESTGDTKPVVLHLHTEFLPYKQLKEKGLPYRLGREVVRQAFLIAAREELGLMTCDETLHETPPEDAEIVDLMVIERVNYSGQWRLSLIKPENDKDIHETPPLWTKSFKSAVGGVRVYGFLTPKLEEYSRGDFVEALRSAGLKGDKPTPKKPSPPSDEIEKTLLTVDFIAQYGAVRAAHKTIAAHGETPEWLSVLVRGYANLAMLTQHQWNTSSEVFAARAWLYAQRMYSSKKKQDFAIWNRAYAWALGGTLQHVQEELERLEQRRAERASKGAGKWVRYLPPAWTKLIEPYAMCDRAAVRNVGEENPELQPWATRLDFQLASAYRQSQWMYEAANDVRNNCPTAYGVYSELAHHGQTLAATRSGARFAPFMLGSHAPASLLALPDLPSDFRAVLSIDKLKSSFLDNVFGDPNPRDGFSAVPTYVARYLRKRSAEKADCDPSWSTLAFLLEEEQFLQIANSLRVSLNATERSLDDDVASVLPLVKDHRFATYIDSYRYKWPHERIEMQKLLKDLVIEDPRRNMSAMFRRIWWIKDSRRQSIGKFAYHAAHRNFTFPGMLEYVYPTGPSWNPDDARFAAIFTREFKGIAPHSETATRMAIQATQDPSLEELQKWESQLSHDPTAFRILAYRYYAKQEKMAAMRCYERSMESLPTFATARDLANLHFELDNREKWEQTLLDYLESENLGLNHALAHQQLANGLCSWGDWQKAKPHAEQAGGTWAAWGLATASYVCEGLADWKASEKWMKEKSTHYPTSSGNAWYLWCKRTGRGNLEAARKLALEYHDRNSKTKSFKGLTKQGTFFLLEDQPEKALESFRKAFDIEPSYFPALMVVQLAGKLNDAPSAEHVISTIDELVEKAPEKPDYDGRGDKVGLAILEVHKTGDASPERLEELNTLLRSVDLNSRSVFAYAIGQELATLGQSEVAEEYWRRALITPNYNTYAATLAGMELARRHGTSRPDDDALDETDLWPKPEKK